MEILNGKRVTDFRIFKKDNNIDGLDNLDELPTSEAVYAICGRINGAPANCRYVGHTNNLQLAIKKHFSSEEPYACLKQFMQSIKIKTINFELMEGSTESERIERKELWEDEMKPACNETLNEVF